MKMIFIISTLLFAVSSHARIGSKKFSHTITADSETVLLEKIEEAIPLIQKGKIRSVFQDDCWPNNSRTIKIRNVNTSKAYRYVDGQLAPYYIGKINYLHKRCRDN